MNSGAENWPEVVRVDGERTRFMNDYEWLARARTNLRVKDRRWSTLRAAVMGRYAMVKRVLRFRFEDRVPAPYNHRPPKRAGLRNPNRPPY